MSSPWIASTGRAPSPSRPDHDHVLFGVKGRVTPVAVLDRSRQLEPRLIEQPQEVLLAVCGRCLRSVGAGVGKTLARVNEATSRSTRPRRG